MQRYGVLILIVLLVTGCSRSNVGDIFPPFNTEDPEQQGWTKNSDGTFVLQALAPGAVFDTSAPSLQAIYPADEATGVDLNTLILFRFSESMATDVAGIRLETSDSSSPVAVTGTFQFAPSSGNRLLVFEPAAALEASTGYRVVITAGLLSAMGEAFDTGSVDEVSYTFETGTADQAVDFAVIDSMTLPADQAEDLWDGTPLHLFFTEAVNVTSATDGLLAPEDDGDDNLSVQDQDSNVIAGTRTFHFGNRLMVFTPSAVLPGGKRIDLTVEGGVKNSDDDESLGTDYTLSFTITDIAVPTALAFPDVDPLIIRPSTLYTGRINSATDEDAFSVDVTVAGSSPAEQITLLIWNGTDKAIIAVFEGTFSAGTHSFEVDLIPAEAEDAGTADPLGATDRTLFVAAYSTRKGVSPAAGPAFDPVLIRKDLEAPSLTSLGPPAESGSQWSVLTELIGLGLHGKASEDLSAVTVSIEVNGSAQNDSTGIKFFSVEYPADSGTLSEEVTLGDGHLFITSYLDLDTSSLVPGAGASFFRGSRAEPPVEITQIVLTDLVGNTTTLDSLTSTTVDFRGYFLPATSGSAEFEVICSDALSLEVIEDVDVIVENVGQGYVRGATTDSDGVAEFSALPSTLLWDGNRMVLTAVKDGYQVQSLVWDYEYSFTPSYNTVSMVLIPETESTLEDSIGVTVENSSDSDLAEVFAARTDRKGTSDQVLVSLGDNPSEGTVTVGGNRLQMLQLLGIATDATETDTYQWAWTDPLITSTGDETTSATFFTAPAEPTAGAVQALAVTPTLGTNASREVRLVAVLNNFLEALPLSADRSERWSSGTSEYLFSVPLPPTLLTNEGFSKDGDGALVLPLDSAELEPAAELILEPALAGADSTDAPSTSVLEERIFFEAEEIGTGSAPLIVRRRLAFASTELGLEREIVMPASMGSPNVSNDNLKWDNVLNDGGDDAGPGAYKLHYENTDATRHWLVLIDRDEAGTAGKATFAFPDLAEYGALSGLTGGNDFADFSTAGEYTFHVEAFQVPLFDFTLSFFASLVTKWESYWRSKSIKVTK